MVNHGQTGQNMVKQWSDMVNLVEMVKVVQDGQPMSTDGQNWSNMSKMFPKRRSSTSGNKSKHKSKNNLNINLKNKS